MYDPLMANLTCIFGQLFILDLIDKIEPYCRLLQTNTDGIFILCENEEMKEKVMKITEDVGKRIKMDFEIEEYTKLIQSNVNNYIAVFKEGDLECKGAMVKYNKPIHNDTSILNDAVRNYLAYETPVEDTINKCNELIKFQKVIKLSAKYKEVWYGSPTIDKTTNKVIGVKGKQLKEKVHRVFASKNDDDGTIYKSKIQKGEKSYERFANTPEHLFIDNSDIHDKPLPEYLDKQYYINEANKRISMFLEKIPEKIDETPNILFESMNKATNFYEFLINCTDNGITKKVLEEYIIADCCNIYGKTKKLLTFRDYFNLLYGKDKFTVKNIDNKIKDEQVKNILFSNATLSKTGKTYTEFNFKKALLEVFDVIPNEQLDIFSIMEMQVKKFNKVRYKDITLNDNRWFVLNTRNVIAPNLILYNIKTGEVQYRKFNKKVFNILPLQDGDVIDVLKTEKEYGVKIIGKDSDGINILAADITKEYDVITQYEIVYRNYKKSGSKLVSEIGDDD